jgi:hypothetical protein
MTERKTSSMLQRVPVILAVTAASYGLQLPPTIGRPSGGDRASVSSSQPVTSAPAQPTDDRRAS